MTRHHPAGAPYALQLQRVTVAYDGAPVFSGVDIAIGSGEVVALLGRNGAGKTTLAHALFNMGPTVEGNILIKGESVRGYSTHRIARLGVALLPQGRGVFAGLSVHESLALATLAKKAVPASWTMARVYEAFPILHEKRRQSSGALSGGERQTLALARALLTQADILVLDEPSEGLSPKAVQDVLVARFATLRSAGLTVLLIEQNLALCLRTADRAIVLAEGGIAFDGPMATFAADTGLQQRLLGV